MLPGQNSVLAKKTFLLRWASHTSVWWHTPERTRCLINFHQRTHLSYWSFFSRPFDETRHMTFKSRNAHSHLSPFVWGPFYTTGTPEKSEHCTACIFFHSEKSQAFCQHYAEESWKLDSHRSVWICVFKTTRVGKSHDYHAMINCFRKAAFSKYFIHITTPRRRINFKTAFSLSKRI